MGGEGEGGLYRRLLYFANLLLCSAAILKEGVQRQRGVDKRVTQASAAKETTDWQERGGGKGGGGNTWEIIMA